MTESEAVAIFLILQKRAASIGITLLVSKNSEYFEFTDVPGVKGSVEYKQLRDAEKFLNGYELGYKSGL